MKVAGHRVPRAVPQARSTEDCSSTERGGLQPSPRDDPERAGLQPQRRLIMQRRTFVRSSLAAALFAPATLTLPDIARAATGRRGGAAGTAADPIRLSSNENPLGVPDTARDAIIDALGHGHRYPALNQTVIARIAALNNVRPDNIVLGNGSAEILQITVQAASIGSARTRVVIADPTFEQVERYAGAMRTEVVKVPLLADHSHDIERMDAAARATDGPVLVFICNPNNPTGTLTSCDALAAWITESPENVWFLVDEAYLEFATDPAYRTFVNEATSRPNVIVSRTLSKIYGLAGIRLGYAIADSATSRRLLDFVAATNINHLAAAAALACFDDVPYTRRSLDINAQGLRLAYRTLDELNVEYLPSHANFVLHRIAAPHDDYMAAMLEHGVRVGRAFPPMTSWNRVSIGLPDEMAQWADAVRALHKRGLV
jgi:histidinol-phosphate aminotransferase